MYWGHVTPIHPLGYPFKASFLQIMEPPAFLETLSERGTPPKFLLVLRESLDVFEMNLKIHKATRDGLQVSCLSPRTGPTGQRRCAESEAKGTDPARADPWSWAARKSSPRKTRSFRVSNCQEAISQCVSFVGTSTFYSSLRRVGQV